MTGGGETTNIAQNLKESATSILGEACFELYKWHSNESVLQINSQLDNEPEQSYAKEQLGVQKGETKLLGLPWDKREDIIGVTLPTESAEPTKRSILGTLAKIYDPLGLISPVTLVGKTLYREACDLKNSWDEHYRESYKSRGYAGSEVCLKRSKFRGALRPSRRYQSDRSSCLRRCQPERSFYSCIRRCFSRVRRQSNIDHFEVALVKEIFIDTKARVGVRAHVSKPTA